MRLYSRKNTRFIDFAIVIASMLFGKQLTDGFDLVGSVIAWLLILFGIIFIVSSDTV